MSCCSVPKSYLTLLPHGLQHARHPCPSLSPGVCSNSHPLSWSCHPIISSSVAPFSSCPQSFPASRSFPMSQLFTSGGQSIEASTSASIFLVNIQGYFPLGLTVLISLQSKGLSKSLLQHSSKASLLQCSGFFMVQLPHPYMTTGKNIAWTTWTSVSKVISLLFNTLSRFAIAFLSRNKHPLILWLQSPSAVILEPKKIKVSHWFAINLPWGDGMLWS